ncbi:MAG: D-alanyl-D-alanine carboxypeptidase [Desulfovibrio sp.]|uniref:D-alanyl-D-alanine carboxypeptidase family protein n=1 Tax=Desulfovibrio sp. TaxID=885 RepID=UPI001A67E4A3|nr:D-alanyl-D-alanine carboxypeptidase family protein [Desulfovibrio sp.]MBD5418095.1 D-alanyl-D-alanine carboxypeptidase [Desulfovibrio sp.]
MPLSRLFRQCRFSRPLRALILLLFLLAPAGAHAAPQVLPASPVGVCSAMVYDLDHDAILFEQNADEPIPPASLTKILSMYLALDHISEGHANADTPVTVSPAAAATGGSRMGLSRHETVPLGRLLLGMAVSSGNDASHAVAEFVGGSVPAFVNMMNVRARALGMNDSLFLNPHGLPAAGQRTTARDMLTLARAYLKSHPDALELHNTRLLTHAGQTTWNKNPLLGQYPGADGLKTGWIRASGYNMVFTASKNGRRLLAVIMGAPDMYARGAEACRLLDAGFLVCENQAVSVTAALDGLPVDARRIDVRKTARDAGLLRPHRAYARAPKASPDRERSLLGKYAQSRQATKARAAYGKKPQGRVTASRGAARAGGGNATAGKKAVDMRTAKRKATLRKHAPGKGAGHAARGGRSRGRSG